MKHVVVEGVAVPAVLASSFNDPSPSRRPFSYTKPLPPCAQATALAPASSSSAAAATTTTSPFNQPTSLVTGSFRPRTSHLSIPRVLPILSKEAMPSNIQYNTPMPIYSREGRRRTFQRSSPSSSPPPSPSPSPTVHPFANTLNSESAEEQYKQQVGTGPEYELGARDRHFDPEKSEALKAIRAGEADDFGRHFNEQIAQAETPHVPPTQEPYWAQAARHRSERARSATPSATYTTPSAQPYYAPHYSTLQHPKKRGEQRSSSATKRGYEFGGLDYVDKSRIPQGSPYIYYGDTHRQREVRQTTPGYEMGGTDYRKGAIRSGGPYHGHGPEQRRLQSKFEQSSLKHDEMNIELAPNVDRVSADILVGDTRSNQHLAKEEHPDHSFGTSFGPITGFTRQHRTVGRVEEVPRPTTFSLSAKKDPYTSYRSSSLSRTNERYQTGPPPFELPPPTELAGYTSQAVTNYASHGTTGTTRVGTGAATGARSDTMGGGTGGMGAISAPYKKTEQTWTRSQSAAPVERYEWANENIQKETYDYEPTWSRIVSSRRNAWEEKARNTDARVQMPPSSKIPPQQPPYWYNKANQTHTLWQSEADRQGRGDGGYGDVTQASYNYAEYGGGQGRHEEYSSQRRHEEYGTAARPTGKDYDGFVSQTQYKTHVGGAGDTENAPRSQAQYHTSYSSSQQYTSEHGAPATQSNYTRYAAVPVGSPHPVSSNIQQQSSTWQSQSSSSRYEQKMRERSTERLMNEQPTMGAIALPAPEPATGTYGIEKTSYQRRTHHETAAPLTTASAVSVTQGSGDFNRRAEMAEILPRGTVANTEASTEGNYVDNEGRPVTYKRELVTSVNPNSESTLLKEEERRVVETPLEPGVISRHVTTKYYKKKTVTDTTTTNTVQ